MILARLIFWSAKACFRFCLFSPLSFLQTKSESKISHSKAILLFTFVALLLGAGERPADAKSDKRVIIIGIDGMDPTILQSYMDKGLMPNFKSLAEKGSFKPLQTTMPPLSPTAWSTFVTGMDPGGHGIFDFVHRDPETMQPYLSMSRALPPSKTFKIGSWVIPVKGGTVEQLRKGKTFWQILEEHGIHTTVYHVPANFPPVKSPGESLSGMGTPDILGTPGTFSFYTDDPPKNSDDISGGKVYPVQVVKNRVDAFFLGPKNTFREVPNSNGSSGGKKVFENPDLKVPFTVHIDPKEPVALFDVPGKEMILKEGEWSDWFRVDFQAVPHLAHVSSIGRFYLQQVRPKFRLYLTPLEINPEDPAMPISTPKDWSADLCENLGYFYTKEFPEETKALSAGIFSGPEFWTQTQFVLNESRRALDYLLGNFKDGLLFFYFSSVDQNCHMLWRYTDVDHPGFEANEKLFDSIQALYQNMDAVLGTVLKAVDDKTTLIVMSDHGFAPFDWGVNLNTWLLEKGYVTLKDPSKQEGIPLFQNVDWSKTKAYAIGLNGLYINVKGRERNGIVDPGKEYDELLDQLETEMLAMRDPRNGKQPITLAVKTHREFHGPYINVGPDIIVGYNRGYRSSWESPLGEFPRQIFVDNKEAWSGDHAMDYRLVPGILLTNKKITLDQPALSDLTVGVLDEFGVAPLKEMIGKDCLGE